MHGACNLTYHVFIGIFYTDSKPKQKEDMNTLLIIQILCSLVIGGSLVAFISLLAEKVDKKIAGALLAFPSTIALGYFFLGWFVGDDAVAKAVPSAFIPMSAALLFIASYTSVAQAVSHIGNRFVQIILATTFSVGVWFAISFLVATNKFSNIWIGVCSYLTVLIAAHFFLKKYSVVKPAPMKYSRKQIAFRATFVGTVIATVVFLGKTMGPVWGVVFAMFPAVSMSILILLHWYYGGKNLFPFVQSFPIGTITMVTYSLTVMLLFPKVGFVFGTVAAYIVAYITFRIVTWLRS